ncbi:MAG: cell wall hydrolase, partial [Oscillospiraceae bacterium]
MYLHSQRPADPRREDYYELNYPSEELFWLSQIIHAEAWQQPLAGQIGVGNVVMNRVNSPDFPSTVFDVIFDMDHNIVQFESNTCKLYQVGYI